MAQRLARQFSRYVLVGGFAMVGHYGTLIALVESGTANAVPAALWGFLVGGLISYGLNYRLTFKSERPHAVAFPAFVLVAAVGFALTGISMHFMVDRLGLPYLPAQLVTTVVVMLWTFTINRAWTFRETSRAW